MFDKIQSLKEMCGNDRVDLDEPLSAEVDPALRDGARAIRDGVGRGVLVEWDGGRGHGAPPS